jgi:hypothetical protein
LSAQYSPQRAVTDYYAAQARGDVSGMMANATYLRGDGSYSLFFDEDGVRQMMAVPQNKDISNVKVVANDRVDDSTSDVTVSMTWAGNPRMHTYVVKRDTTRVHDFFYYSWRIQIPYININVTVPNQPGPVVIDTLGLPPGSVATTVQAIEGYHEVTMQGTDFYDESSQLANGVDGDAAVKFDSKLNSLATASAAASVKAAFSSCDAVKYDACPGHTYLAPNNQYIWFLTLPGYPEIDFTKYVYTLRTDPTADMQLVVTNETGKVTGSGSCAVMLTVDGSRKYSFTGSWTATLTWSQGGFGSDVVFDCATAKA